MTAAVLTDKLVGVHEFSELGFEVAELQELANSQETCQYLVFLMAESRMELKFFQELPDAEYTLLE